MVDALDFAERATILVVDDMPENLRVMSDLLKEKYKVQVVTSGERALKAVADNPPDLVLLDIMMPGMDGYEVCRRLVADPKTSGIPIIFLTGKTQVEDEEMGFELGAADYIAKPISPPIVMARVRIQLMLKAARDFLKDQSAFLEAEVKRRSLDHAELQSRTIQAFAQVAEKIVAAGKDKPLDPAMAQAFFDVAEQIRDIAAKYAKNGAAASPNGSGTP